MNILALIEYSDLIGNNSDCFTNDNGKKDWRSGIVPTSKIQRF